ncbi:hypothetical protein CMUS01_16198 [Colletotrichum musicola]|uniref:Uncharacterized protein n=1 Tax=Colletotrichum musicola TaxID=2175873 RepID=A0A8H6MK59_9PEZI|nr:hypothetical protein CMUS01_16198 [Colletotrichum musicola]
MIPAMTLEITGNLQKRFMQDAALLFKLDPVRGSPTTYGLDLPPNSAEGSREAMLKRKFLDSVALLASTHKDGDRVSAATLEEGAPEGTVVRIASNNGVPDSTLLQLRELMADLSNIAITRNLTPQIMTEMLLKIIRLDIEKISHYFAKLRKVRSEVLEMQKHLPQLSARFAPAEVQQFSSWMENLVTITNIPADEPPDSTNESPDSTGEPPERLLPHIRWAEKAKWEYSAYVEAIFAAQGVRQQPRWIYNVYKLGRYAVSCRALCLLALEHPALFSSMRVEAVTAPPRVTFSFPDEDQPLREALRRVKACGLHQEEDFMRMLALFWDSPEPDLHLRETCDVGLAVHAEMQLLSFYDAHPELLPSFQFIGVSKKSCFLCHRFLQGHPTSFSVSSCHQKLYLAWKLPATSDPKVYKMYKGIVSNMCVSMESTAKQELRRRIGGVARTVPLDSTAGVSLSGLVDWGPPSPVDSHSNVQDNYEHQAEEPSPQSDDDSIPSEAFEQESVETPPRNDDGGAVSEHAHAQESAVEEAPPPPAYEPPVYVFNVVRADDSQRRDLVSSRDIAGAGGFEPGHTCSWRRLVEILGAGERFGVRFNEEAEFLVVNNRMRVGNERQFHACLHFLHNSGCRNADVVVHTYASLYPVVDVDIDDGQYYM